MITNLQIIEDNIEYIISQINDKEPLLENCLIIQEACNELIENEDINVFINMED